MHPSGQRQTRRTPIHGITQQSLATILASSGYSFGLIADTVGTVLSVPTTRQQITLDVGNVIEQHRQLCPTDPEEARILQIARLEMISNLALQGFLDSATTDSTTISEDVSDKTDSSTDRPKRRTQTRTRKAGDAKFLAIMQGIEVERSKILGVYAPERKEEVGQLTVTFSWADTPQPAQKALEADATDASYTLLADSASPQTDPE